jgi:hypothetical protein
MSPGLAWRAERGLTAALVAAGLSSLVANPREDPALDLVELAVGEAVRRALRHAAREQQDHAGQQGGGGHGDEGTTHLVLLDRWVGAPV